MFCSNNPLIFLEQSVGLSTVLNELAFHPCAIVTPNVLAHVPLVAILIAPMHLTKPELKIAS
jgi:hypothetical protein